MPKATRPAYAIKRAIEPEPLSSSAQNIATTRQIDASQLMIGTDA